MLKLKISNLSILSEHFSHYFRGIKALGLGLGLREK